MCHQVPSSLYTLSVVIVNSAFSNKTQRAHGQRTNGFFFLQVWSSWAGSKLTTRASHEWCKKYLEHEEYQREGEQRAEACMRIEYAHDM